jgi:hypothetical protein
MAMDAPATIKDVQKLTGCMAALNRFLSRLGERDLPFFKLLKRQDKFEWTTEAAEALENFKHHLQSPPIPTAPLPGEELLLYIITTTHVVSTVIVVERPEEGRAYSV